MKSETKFMRLIDLCNDIIDCPHSSPKWQSSGIPIIRNFNIKDGRIDQSSLSYVDEKTYAERIKRALPEKDDIIISREAPMGAVAIIPQNFKCCLGQRLVLLKINKKKCEPKYLLYALQSQYVQEQIKRANTTGSIVSNLNIPDIGNLLIPYIKIDDQKRIGNVIANIDNKIDINNHLSEIANKVAKIIYNYWFLQFDFPDENGKPYRSSGGKMVWNEELRREVPEGWEVKELFDAMDVCYGYPLATSLFADNGTPVIRIRDIINHTISAYTNEDVNEKYISHSGDLLIGLDGNFQMTIWHRNGDCINQRILRIRKGLLPPLVVKFQIEPIIKKKIDFVARSTVGHLGDEDLKDLKLIIPDRQVGLGIFDNISSEMCSLEKENKELSALRNFLLPLLMNGQVTIGE